MINMKIKKKCYTPFFDMILSGRKNIELRLNDFEVEDGDILVLLDRDPTTGKLTGRTMEKKVISHYKVNPFGWYDPEEMKGKGFVIMELGDVKKTKSHFKHIRKCPYCRGRGQQTYSGPGGSTLLETCSECKGKKILEFTYKNKKDAYIEGFKRPLEYPYPKDVEAIEREFTPVHMQDLPPEEAKKILLEKLKDIYNLMHKIDFEHGGLASKYFGKLFDLFGYERKGIEFDHLKADLKEQVIDADDAPIRCSRCGNDEDFKIYIDELYLTLKKGSNEIIDLSGETRMWKPTEVVFVCDKCNCVALEGCFS